VPGHWIAVKGIWVVGAEARRRTPEPPGPTPGHHGLGMDACKTLPPHSGAR